jgi:hypothetical protein
MAELCPKKDKTMQSIILPNYAKGDRQVCQKTSKRYDPNRPLSRFETIQKAKTEDRKRVASLRRTLKKLPNGELAYSIKCLIDELESDEAKSLASSSFMREYRSAIVSNLWRLIAHLLPGDAFTATLIPNGSAIPFEDLDTFDVVKFLKRLRQALYRCGAKEASGFLFIVFHGEYVPRDDGPPLFQPHFHILGTGDMRKVIKWLRKTRLFRSTRDNDGMLSVQRVRISKQPLTHLPAPITYLLQSYWPSKWVGMVNGKQVRVRNKGRLPDDAHTQMLLWLDRHSLKDLTMMVGLRVDKHGRIVLSVRKSIGSA